MLNELMNTGKANSQADRRRNVCFQHYLNEYRIRDQ